MSLSWLGSLLVHVSIMAALGSCLVPLAGGPMGPTIETEWGTDDAEATLPLVADVSSPLQAMTESAPVSGVTAWAGEMSGAAGLRVPTGFAGNSDAVPLDLTERVPAPRGSGGPGATAGVGAGAGSGAAQPGGGFFATDRPRGRYVFVVDASKSMNHPYAGPARTRFGRAKLELWRTILRMSSEQQYFIVFFNTHSLPMPSAGWRPGGPEGQQDLFRWTASVPATGGTEPQDALLLALQLQPDVIYLLTDGQFNFRAVHAATKANVRGVQINTVALSDDSGSRVLMDLAGKNHGTYRHIVESEDSYSDELPRGVGSKVTESAPTDSVANP
jgi:hypothetical protein